MNNLKNEILMKASNVGNGEKFLAVILGEKLSEECSFLKKMKTEEKSKRDISMFISDEKSLAVLYITKPLENPTEMDPYFEFLYDKNITSSSVYAYSKESELIELNLKEDFVFEEELRKKICF